MSICPCDTATIARPDIDSDSPQVGALANPLLPVASLEAGDPFRGTSKVLEPTRKGLTGLLSCLTMGSPKTVSLLAEMMFLILSFLAASKIL